jgi:hypothetical protein
VLVTEEPTTAGVLTIRAWREGEDHRLRARLLLATDVTGEVKTAEVASSVDEVCSIVRTWLDDMLSSD